MRINSWKISPDFKFIYKKFPKTVTEELESPDIYLKEKKKKKSRNLGKK